MSILRRLIPIVLAVATTSLAAPAMAGSNHGGVGGPEMLPPNTVPGQCVSRRVTGPGGAYRWDRVECDSAYNSYGQGYGYGGGYGGGLQVQTQGGYGYQGGGYQTGYAADCGCAGYQGGYRYENPCDPCSSYGGGYAGGYSNGGGYAGDRYGERRYDSRSSQYQYEYGSSAYGSGYAYGRGGQGVNYPPPYGYGYVAAGRDEAGYLIWPGKTP